MIVAATAVPLVRLDRVGRRAARVVRRARRADAGARPARGGARRGRRVDPGACSRAARSTRSPSSSSRAPSERRRRARDPRHDADRVGGHARARSTSRTTTRCRTRRGGTFLVGGPSNAGGLFLNWATAARSATAPSRVDPARVPVWVPYPRGERVPLQDPDRARRSSSISTSRTVRPRRGAPRSRRPASRPGA